MKRQHSVSDFNRVDHLELNRKTAMHEAGHAAAIYFGNRKRRLPPVFFQIIVNHCSCRTEHHYCTTRVDGGRLIHTLPSSLEEATRNFSLAQQQAYRLAFEADIVNLLVGSLAEANYVAQRDNELINPRLLPLEVLPNYGGAFDLEMVQQYLNCFIVDKSEQDKKVTELFWQAFEFISDWSHWYAITALSSMILNNQDRVLEYEEIVYVLDHHFTLAQKFRQRTVF